MMKKFFLIFITIFTLFAHEKVFVVEREDSALAIIENHKFKNDIKTSVFVSSPNIFLKAKSFLGSTNFILFTNMQSHIYKSARISPFVVIPR